MITRKFKRDLHLPKTSKDCEIAIVARKRLKALYRLYFEKRK